VGEAEVTTADRTSIMARLEAIKQQVQHINQLVKLGEPADIEIAREQFSRLKEHLRAEYRRMDTKKGEARLSDLEKAFYWAAIQDAWANTVLPQTRADWTPSKWHDALWNVEDYVDYHLDGLRRSQEQERRD
jgi:hypothetical protein